jgi:hypothetical protein
MQVEKLLTLSQFVEYLYNEWPLTHHGLLNAAKAERFDLIVNYMQFLKQPLKKEMFVNAALSPGGLILRTKEAFSAWEKAEKEIIFKNIEDADIGASSYIQTTGGITIKFNALSCGSLHDLAEATKGKLEIKNVEL